jgi:threonine dehydratase/serine racemase
MRALSETPAYATSAAESTRARAVLRGVAHLTPVLTCATLDALSGRSLFLKCENLQKGGAFKFRGAYFALSQLAPTVRARGVVTHSSGNHAQALALAARSFGVAAHIVMPTNAPAVKRRAVEGYGGRVIPCEPTLAARESTAARVVADTGATLIPPYDHPHIIAGQGTAALELLEQVPGLDAIVAPVGGGGLLSGVALATAGTAPGVLVFGAEPANADDAARSKAAGHLIPVERADTIADGLRTSLGGYTWPVIRDLVDEILTVSEDEIRAAQRLLWERCKLVVEPSGAVPLAAALGQVFAAKPGLSRVGLVLSGGNVDFGPAPSSVGEK